MNINKIVEVIDAAYEAKDILREIHGVLQDPLIECAWPVVCRLEAALMNLPDLRPGVIGE